MNPLLKNKNNLVVIATLVAALIIYFIFRSSLLGHQSEQRIGKLWRRMMAILKNYL
jgi:hypothetical protein